MKEKIKNFFERLRRAKLSLSDQARFAMRLSHLLGASVSLSEALSMISGQYARSRRSWIFEQIESDVERGFSLSRSLSGLPGVFENFAISVIRIGEESGLLRDNLAYLAEELEKKHALRQKTFGALVYPACVSLAAVLLTIFLIAFVFPKITPVFRGLRIDLPLSTSILIAISDFMRNYWVWLALSIATLPAVAAWTARKFLKVRVFWDRLLLRLPFVGKVAADYNIANLARSLGLLLKGGMHLSEAVSVAAESLSNEYYRERFKTVARDAGIEGTLAKHLDREKIFPEIFHQMVAVGERSGTLSESLLYCARIFDGEVENQTKNLSSSLEPALMVVLGLTVGFIAVSIITPIYEITENLRR